MACGLFYVCHICFKLVDKTITANLACGRVSGLVTQPFSEKGEVGDMPHRFENSTSLLCQLWQYVKACTSLNMYTKFPKMQSAIECAQIKRLHTYIVCTIYCKFRKLVLHIDGMKSVQRIFLLLLSILNRLLLRNSQLSFLRFFGIELL